MTRAAALIEAGRFGAAAYALLVSVTMLRSAWKARVARDPWPLGLFALHVAHSLWFAHVYPAGIWDPDLVAYFVYFGNWMAGIRALHVIDYFTVPKPLLVFVLGPLGSAVSAFAISALVSGLLGALVYLVSRSAFGRCTAILASLALLLDVDRATLALRSSGDLYLTALLFGAIWCTLQRRYVASGFAIALAVLVKPVALPCGLHLLAVAPADRRRALRGVVVVAAAVPLVFLSNLALLGSVLGPARFFAGFDAYSQGSVMPASELLRFVVWVQLKQTIFTASAPLGFLGLVLWLAHDKERLSSPVLLVPILFLLGYLAMSVVRPFVPFFRFFWPIQVWFLCFVVFGCVETARRLARPHRRLQLAILGALLFFLADDQLERQLRYRSHFAGPFQEAMTFVESAQPHLEAERVRGETVLAPLAFLPWLMWKLPDVRRRPELVLTAEHESRQAIGSRAPDWLLYMPRAYLDGETRSYVESLARSGRYESRFAGADAALLARTDRYRSLALHRGLARGAASPEAAR